MEKVESTSEIFYTGIKEELKIEQEKAMVDKDTTEEADKKLCQAQP